MGRFVICLFIVIGIYMIANETSRLVNAFSDDRMGKKSLFPSR